MGLEWAFPLGLPSLRRGCIWVSLAFGEWKVELDGDSGYLWMRNFEL
jgi:hypothetical protein